MCRYHLCHYARRRFAGCHNVVSLCSFVSIQSVTVLNIVLLSITVLDDLVLSVERLSVVILRVVALGQASGSAQQVNPAMKCFGLLTFLLLPLRPVVSRYLLRNRECRDEFEKDINRIRLSDYGLS